MMNFKITKVTTTREVKVSDKIKEVSAKNGWNITSVKEVRTYTK